MHLRVAMLAVPACGIGLAWLLVPSSTPDAAAVQIAYEREAAAGDKRHDKGLRVIAADCSVDKLKQYVCWIKFVSLNENNQRLYFDAISLARENGEWRLKSGLCRS